MNPRELQYQQNRVTHALLSAFSLYDFHKIIKEIAKNDAEIITIVVAEAIKRNTENPISEAPEMVLYALNELNIDHIRKHLKSRKSSIAELRQSACAQDPETLEDHKKKSPSSYVIVKRHPDYWKTLAQVTSEKSAELAQTILVPQTDAAEYIAALPENSAPHQSDAVNAPFPNQISLEGVQDNGINFETFINTFTFRKLHQIIKEHNIKKLNNLEVILAEVYHCNFEKNQLKDFLKVLPGEVVVSKLNQVSLLPEIGAKLDREYQKMNLSILKNLQDNNNVRLYDRSLSDVYQYHLALKINQGHDVPSRATARRTTTTTATTTLSDTTTTATGPSQDDAANVETSIPTITDNASEMPAHQARLLASRLEFNKFLHTFTFRQFHEIVRRAPNFTQLLGILSQEYHCVLTTHDLMGFFKILPPQLGFTRLHNAALAPLAGPGLERAYQDLPALDPTSMSVYVLTHLKDNIHSRLYDKTLAEVMQYHLVHAHSNTPTSRAIGLYAQLFVPQQRMDLNTSATTLPENEAQALPSPAIDAITTHATSSTTSTSQWPEEWNNPEAWTESEVDLTQFFGATLTNPNAKAQTPQNLTPVSTPSSVTGPNGFWPQPSALSTGPAQTVQTSDNWFEEMFQDNDVADIGHHLKRKADDADDSGPQWKQQKKS